MNKHFIYGFSDELEKIAGLPRYLKNLSRDALEGKLTRKLKTNEGQLSPLMFREARR